MATHSHIPRMVYTFAVHCHLENQNIYRVVGANVTRSSLSNIYLFFPPSNSIQHSLFIFHTLSLHFDQYFFLHHFFHSVLHFFSVSVSSLSGHIALRSFQCFCRHLCKWCNFFLYVPMCGILCENIFSPNNTN